MGHQVVPDNYCHGPKPITRDLLLYARLGGLADVIPGAKSHRKGELSQRFKRVAAPKMIHGGGHCQSKWPRLPAIDLNRFPAVEAHEEWRQRCRRRPAVTAGPKEKT